MQCKHAANLILMRVIRLGVAALACVVLFASESLPAAAQEPIPVETILANPAAYRESGVIVEGEVGSAPQFSELRAGIPYGRFDLRGASGSLNVVAPASFAMNLLSGYRVRLRGTLKEVNGGYELELSQVAGEMRILERNSQPTLPTALLPMSVPVQPLATNWSIAVDVAAIAAAVFSFVAMLPIVLSRRRYNVGLKVTEYEAAYIEALPSDDRFELHLPLRLMPTKTLPPILKRRISLRINNEEIAEDTIRIAKIQPAADFPLHVQAEIRLLLEAIVLRDRLSLGENRLIVTFKDDLCWRKFSAPFSVSSPSLVFSKPDSEMSTVDEKANTTSSAATASNAMF